MQPVFVVVGESLIDLVDSGGGPCLAYPGGSPLNVAIGLARLGRPTAFVGRFSRDPFGTVLRNHALRSQVDLSLTVDATQPSTIALVTVDDTGAAHYDFSVEGTADFAWTDADLADLPAGACVAHFGSLASWLPPGDVVIGRRMAELHAAGDVLISYDPNVRPQLQPDAAAARAQVEGALRLAHLVKASDEDLHWLYADEDAEKIARRWLAAGPSLVVLTRGGDGSVAFTPDAPAIRRPISPGEIVDTVGAGDAFMSGLLDALARRGISSPDTLASLDGADLPGILNDAALVAAITCSRAGADPPRREELDERRATLLTL